jgi:hypothetical protein
MEGVEYWEVRGRSSHHLAATENSAANTEDWLERCSSDAVVIEWDA